MLTQKPGIPEIREFTKNSAPLIHCITNPISIHDCANMILAVGARPIMAEHPEEVEEITEVSSALMLNLGNITDARIISMQRALSTANRKNIPVLLDLVGVTCSQLRRSFAKKLLSQGVFSVIKGNISEILAAAELPYHGTGIDAGSQDAVSVENQAWYCETAKHLAKHLNCTVMATGKKDLIADAESAFLVSNGHAALSGVTGTGCMVGALTAAYLPGSKAIFTKSGIFETSSLIPDKTKVSYGTAAALLAAVAMGISGELAAEISKGPGSFQTALLDEVYAMTDETLLEKARLQEFLPQNVETL